MNKVIISTLIIVGFLAILARTWLLDIAERFISFAAPFGVLILILAGIVAIIAAGAVALRIIDWLLDMLSNSKHDRALKRIEVQKLEREANVWVDIAAPGSLIVRHSTNKYQVLSEPLHLSPGPINGRPSAFTDAELHRWALHAMSYGRGKALPAPQTIEVLAPLLPKVVDSQRLIIAGGSDSGKSTLAKHLITARTDHSKMIIIDPHSPSRLLGYDVIGAGRKYDDIGAALESLVLLMDSRYNDIAKGIFGYGEHNRITIMIDEWTSINSNCPEAGKLLKLLLTESRKASMHLVLMVHSLTTAVMGIDAQIRASAMQVQLEGGNGIDRQAYILPSGKGPNSSKKEWSEYTLPGPFSEYAEHNNIIVDLPDSFELKVRSMASDGHSNTKIARTLLSDGKAPNGRHIKRIKAILENDNTTTNIRHSTL